VFNKPVKPELLLAKVAEMLKHRGNPEMSASLIANRTRSGSRSPRCAVVPLP